MEAHRDSLLILGAAILSLSVYGSYYFYKQGIKDRSLYRDLINLCSKQQQINFKEIKDKKQQKKVILNGVHTKDQIDSIRIFERQVSVYNLSRIDQHFYQQIVGKPFVFKHKGYNIKCEMNSTVISSKVLGYIAKPHHAFQNSTLQPLTKNYQINLLSKLLTIYGILKYDNNGWIFSLKPLIIGQSIEDICSYYEVQSLANWVLAGLLGILSIGIGAFLYQPIKKKLIRIINFFQILPLIQEGQQEYFKNLQPYIIRGSQKFQCLNCNSRFSDIVFDCGHISVCSECHEKGQTECKICHKRSRRFMKIFIG